MSNAVIIGRCNKYSMFRACFEHSCKLLFVTDVNYDNSASSLSAGNLCVHSTIRRHYNCSNINKRRPDYFTKCRYYSQDDKTKFNVEDGRTFKTTPCDQTSAGNQGETSSKPKYQSENPLLEVEYWKGLPRLTIPLPSRKELCRFTLKPITNTVADFVQMICQEDGGVDRVIFCTKDGTKIASSITIELLMHEEQFYLMINDTKYTVRIPESQIKSFTKDEMERLSDVRNLVSQLYEALQVKELHAHTEKELVSRLENIRGALEPLERERKALEKKVSVRTSLLTWVGLGMMGVQFGILARLTWWEYSWDIMEPVTYFVTYGTAMAMYAYFAITREDYVLPDVRDRQYLIYLHKRAKKTGFDIERYNELTNQLSQVQTDLNKLKDPLRFNRTSLSTYSSSTSSWPSSIDHDKIEVTVNGDDKSALDHALKYLKAQLVKIKKFKW